MFVNDDKIEGSSCIDQEHWKLQLPSSFTDMIRSFQTSHWHSRFLIYSISQPDICNNFQWNQTLIKIQQWISLGTKCVAAFSWFWHCSVLYWQESCCSRALLLYCLAFGNYYFAVLVLAQPWEFMVVSSILVLTASSDSTSNFAILTWEHCSLSAQ